MLKCSSTRRFTAPWPAKNSVQNMFCSFENFELWNITASKRKTMRGTRNPRSRTSTDISFIPVSGIVGSESIAGIVIESIAARVSRGNVAETPSESESTSTVSASRRRSFFQRCLLAFAPAGFFVAAARFPMHARDKLHEIEANKMCLATT